MQFDRARATRAALGALALTGLLSVEAASGAETVSVKLVKDGTNQVIQDLNSGQTLTLSELPASLDVTATSTRAQSVRFCLDGKCRVETNAPFTLDDHSDSIPWNPAVGNRNLVVTAYSGRGGSGSVLGSREINFTVQSRRPVTPPPPVAPVLPPKPAEPTPAPATPPNPSNIFNGTFDNGSLNAFDAIQGAASDRITATTETARKGRYAAKLTADNADLQGGSNPRAQLMTTAIHKPGQEHYVGWSTYFPSSFPTIPATAGAFYVFFQFHGKPYNGSPPLGFDVEGNRIVLKRGQQYGYDSVWSMPLVRGRWVDFVARIKWSKSERDGFVELWINGEKQTFSKNGQQRLSSQTVQNDQNVGVKTIPTNYRRKDMIKGKITVMHDEVKVGSSYGAVAP